jgi:hypothetical protein
MPSDFQFRSHRSNTDLECEIKIDRFSNNKKQKNILSSELSSGV